MSKDLKEKAIEFKGKKYVLVSDRVLFFNSEYPNGSITTEMLNQPIDKNIAVKATVKPYDDKNIIFTGHSQAVVGEGYINKTSALENAETSAVGRALAMMGIGVIESIASMDEINKAKNMEHKSYPAQRIIEEKKNITKAEIKKLADELNPLLSSAEDYTKFVIEKTKLPLTTENYEEIIDRLKAIIKERK